MKNVYLAMLNFNRSSQDLGKENLELFKVQRVKLARVYLKLLKFIIHN